MHLNLAASANPTHLNSSTHNNSKYGSLNTSFLHSRLGNINNFQKSLKNQNQSKNYKNNSSFLKVEEEEADEITDTARGKLSTIKEVLKELGSRYNPGIDKAVGKIMSNYLNKDKAPGHNNTTITNITTQVNKSKVQNNHQINNPPSYEKENKLLKSKIEEIDKKFEVILKENRELKQLIKNKTEQFLRLHNDMDIFKKEIKNIKSGKDKKMHLTSLGGSPVKSSYYETNTNTQTNANNHSNIYTTNGNDTIQKNITKQFPNQNIVLNNKTYNGLRKKSVPVMKSKNITDQNGVCKSKSKKRQIHHKENSIDFSRLGNEDHQ